MNDDQIMSMVQEKISEYSGRYQRMDKTKNLLQDAYVLKNFEGQKPNKVLSVNRKTAGWHAQVETSKLSSIEWQTVVESAGKLSPTTIRHVEQFDKDMRAQADEHHRKSKGIAGGLDAYHAAKIVRRGLIGNFIWLYTEDGELVVDIRGLDMRWTPYELDEWMCMRTRRTAAQIKKKYGENLDIAGKNIEVWDFWDKDVERVFLRSGGIASSDTFQPGTRAAVGWRKIAENENEFGNLHGKSPCRYGAKLCESETCYFLILSHNKCHFGNNPSLTSKSF